MITVLFNVCIAVSVLMLLTRVALTQAETYVYVTKLETSTHTTGISVDSVGNIYIVDEDKTVTVYDSNGNIISKWTHNDIHEPTGIAVDYSGNIYVTDWLYNSILKFDFDGNLIKSWHVVLTYTGSHFPPDAVATDKSGNIYVASDLLVMKFDSEGNVLGEWWEFETEHTKMGTMDIEANGIAVDNWGNIYVTYNGGPYVWKLDNNCSFIAEWGSPNYRPLGISVDKNGNIFTIDSSKIVRKFDPDGNIVTEWEIHPNLNFLDPAGVTVDGNDNVYVLGRYSNSILKFHRELGNQQTYPPDVLADTSNQSPPFPSVPVVLSVSFDALILFVAFKWGLNPENKSRLRLDFTYAFWCIILGLPWPFVGGELYIIGPVIWAIGATIVIDWGTSYHCPHCGGTIGRSKIPAGSNVSFICPNCGAFISSGNV